MKKFIKIFNIINLKKVGLNVRFDKEMILFNDASYNAWNKKKKNTPNNVKCISKLNNKSTGDTLMNFDNWSFFKLKKEFIYKVLLHNI